MTACSADPILDQQMTAIYSGLDAISNESHDPALGCNPVCRVWFRLGNNSYCRTLHISLYINYIRNIRTGPRHRKSEQNPACCLG